MSWPPFTLPVDGEHHCPWKIRGPIFASSSARNSPVRLSSAIRLGALGEGMFECVQSCPLDVFTYTMSPMTNGAQSDALCGNTPSSPIMSYCQMMSASFGPGSIGGAGRSVGLALSRITSLTTYLASSLNGPSLPSAIPLLSRQSTSQRLLTRYTRSPSLVGEDSRPRLSQSLTLPEASLGTTSCHSNSPVFSSKQIGRASCR